MSEEKVLIHLSPEILSVLNEVSIKIFPSKKSDKYVLRNPTRLREIAESIITNKGDIYDKAVILIREITQAHVFASANRRTAFLSTFTFLTVNKAKFGFSADEDNSEIFKGIRYKHYSDSEIREWIINGKIRRISPGELRRSL
jgi:death-on-curing family protein